MLVYMFLTLPRLFYFANNCWGVSTTPIIPVSIQKTPEQVQFASLLGPVYMEGG